jgi:lysophospholipase L1-like esterase
MRSRLTLSLLALLVSLGCGGGGSNTPSGPSEPPVPTYTVNATVFYDENGNGQLDASEAVRVPGVDVVIGTGSGKSAAGSGVAQVTGIREGSFQVSVRTESLPTYYQTLPQFATTVQVPGGASEVRVPLALQIGNNQANVYFGYGDSITAGDGSSDREGYRLKLQGLLGPYFGRADVRKFGRSGTNSAEGEQRARLWIGQAKAAYVLILYGTNDWHDTTCQNKGPEACFTVDMLREMVDITRSLDSLPVLGTIPPVNPAKAPDGRNIWIDQMNVRIKAMALQQQVLLADVNAEFKASSGGLPPLYADDVHPNDAGYQVLAQAWFKAITRARSASASAADRGLFGFTGLGSTDRWR